MAKTNILLGKAAEEKACELLKKQDYRILARNYRNRFGEIDIVAKDKDTVCFIEVKSRSCERFGLPQEALSKIKQRRLFRLAMFYLKENNLLDCKARFDVVTIRYNQGREEVDLIRNAFEVENNFID